MLCVYCLAPMQPPLPLHIIHTCTQIIEQINVTHTYLQVTPCILYLCLELFTFKYFVISLLLKGLYDLLRLVVQSVIVL